LKIIVVRTTSNRSAGCCWPRRPPITCSRPGKLIRHWLLEAVRGAKAFTTVVDGELERALDKVKRNFTTTHPNPQWVIATPEWVDWYGKRRIMESIGNMPPSAPIPAPRPTAGKQLSPQNAFLRAFARNPAL